MQYFLFKDIEYKGYLRLLKSKKEFLPIDANIKKR